MAHQIFSLTLCFSLLTSCHTPRIGDPGPGQDTSVLEVEAHQSSLRITQHFDARGFLATTTVRATDRHADVTRVEVAGELLSVDGSTSEAGEALMNALADTDPSLLARAHLASPRFDIATLIAETLMTREARDGTQALRELAPTTGIDANAALCEHLGTCMTETGVSEADATQTDTISPS